MDKKGLELPLLFMLPALIWGSTFFVIKFQLGVVPPIWSVSYRFLAGGLILLTFSKARRLKLEFGLKDHLTIALQGVLLFGFNYWLVYISEKELVSALVAIAFSTLIFFNIIFGSVLLKRKTNQRVYLGALFGLVGTVLLFYQELRSISYESWPVISTILCALSVVIASLGNITSAYNSGKGLPVIQVNGYGMIYGGLTMAVIALLTGESPAFDLSFNYVGSLLYLTILGSVIAFGTYLTLISNIGPDRAAYVLVMIPVFALVLSIVFEGYQWSWIVMLGIASILFGNVLVLRKKKLT